MTRKALVVVMGDLARSPRMQYHCISLAQNNYEVTVIANGGGPSGDKSCELLEGNNKIRQILTQYNNIDFRSYLPSLLAYVVKTIWQSMLLIMQLFFVAKPRIILVQNPPSIPTLPILYLYSCIVRCSLVIDWHNFGFTIFAMNRANRVLVGLMKNIELFIGRRADAGFCVSRAMQKTLIRDYFMTYPIHVLYDRPPVQFKPLDSKEKISYLSSVSEHLPSFRSFAQDSVDRPAIVMTSTSWTEDEDFGLLLDALRQYESYRQDSKLGFKLPDLVCVITGKGPLKAHYEKQIQQLNLKHIQFELPWLLAKHYPYMVGSSDIGISLHSSSSGVDLPMKVVDFFGCGVPVLAYKYKAINELVVEGKFGQTFNDSRDLFAKLQVLLEGFHLGKRDKLNDYRRNIINDFLKLRWDANWTQIAKPLLNTL